MAGLLDDLFAQPKDTGGIVSWMPPDDQAFEGLDTTGSVPVMRKKTKEETDKEAGDKLDADKKFVETHPYTPQGVPGSGAFPAIPPKNVPQMPGPGLGMLGPEMGGPYGAAPSAQPVAPPPPLQTAEVKPAPVPAAPIAQPEPPAMNAMAQQPAATPQVRGSPAEDAIDLRDAPFGMLSKAWDGIKNNSNLLMGMGAGMMGAPSWAQGFGRGFAGAQAGAAQDQRLNLQTGGAQQLYQALVSAGVPRQQAIAATTNKGLADALIKSHIEDRGKEIQMIKTKDGWGNETEVPYIKNKFPAEGEPVLTPAFSDGQGNAAPAPGSGSASGATFAPGVTAQNFDHTKVGDEYLSQYSPEMQDWVKNYLAGNGMPTGRQASSQMIKAAAMKYGTDIGMPPDDASIGQRKVWSNSLGNTTSGVGLASKGFKQGLEHFVKLSDNLVKMNLSNGMGLEPIAGVINGAKNLTTAQQELVKKSDVIGQALAREMGNLFSKNGGGVHEAAETKKNVSNSTMSSKAAAGSLEAIDELMQGGLRTLEQRRDELFPNGNAPKGSQFLGPEQKAALEHIRNNIAILKGEQPAPSASAAAPSAAPAPGSYVYQGPGKGMVRVQ